MKNVEYVKLALLFGVFVSTSVSRAAVTAGTGGGMGLDVDLSAGVGPLALGLSLSQEAFIEVNAPAPDTLTASTLSVNESVALLGSVVAENGASNAIFSSVSSDVNGSSVVGNSSGMATLVNLGIVIVPGVIALTPDFLNLTSTTIASTSTSGGSAGSLNSIGSVTLEGLALSINGIPITLDSNPAPNTLVDISAAAGGIISLAGLSITLNEQIPAGDGLSSTGMTTNAIHISLVDMDLGLAAGNVNGEIIIAQSSSTLAAAIPEPSFLGFFAWIPLLALRRRRNG